MFNKIQHIGYQVRNLDEAVIFFEAKFSGIKIGSGQAQLGGRNAFITFGNIEVELLEPLNRLKIPAGTLNMHHVGYLVSDIIEARNELTNRGLKFTSDTPAVNHLSHQVLWLDQATTNDCMIHLTQLPDKPIYSEENTGLSIDGIIHAGYVVDNLETAVAWYVKKFDGEYIGGGMSRRGINNAFVNFGGVQVELLEPNHKDQLHGQRHHMDHVGYVTRDINSCISESEARGLTMGEPQPRTNVINQLLCYFDTSSTCGTQIHLTQLP